MMIQIDFPSDQQAELERRAAAAGIDPAQFVLMVVQERLGEPDKRTFRKLPYQQWKRLFDQWTDQPSRNPNFDDSRESIYP